MEDQRPLGDGSRHKKRKETMDILNFCKEQVKIRLDAINEDDRLKEPTATITVNAPLALEQLRLETMRADMNWFLSLLGER